MTSDTLFQVVLGLGALVAVWSRQRRAAAKAAAPAQPDPAAEEQTRRVQETIRRKIAQRSAKPSPSAPDFAPAQDARSAFEAGLMAPSPPQPAPASPVAEAPPLRRDPSAAPPARRDWLGELREAPDVRRAIVLREILGPPAGLR